MRHGKKRTSLGRQQSHRIATLKSMARALILHERIRTTSIKAKEARKVVEKLITLAKFEAQVKPGPSHTFSMVREDWSL